MKYKDMLDRILEKLEEKDEILTEEEFKFIVSLLKREKQELEDTIENHVSM